MISKSQIENFLRINGIPATAPDEEVRSALISAKWTDHDAEVALTVLRGHTHSEEVDVIASRQLFHSDSKISSKSLSHLLGIEVPDRDGQTVRMHYQKQQRRGVGLIELFAMICMVAIMLTAGAIMVF